MKKELKKETEEETINRLMEDGVTYSVLEMCKAYHSERVKLMTPKANLGVARTSELIYELSARCDTGSIDKGGSYRTIDY